MYNVMRTVIITCIIATVAVCGGGTAYSQEGAQPRATNLSESKRNVDFSQVGNLTVDVRDILGKHRAARIIIRDFSRQEITRINAPEGQAQAQVPIGLFQAYIEVYDSYVPYLVSVQTLDITETTDTRIEFELLEGAAEGWSLADFDQDGDLAISRVELETGTNPENALSLPGTLSYKWPDQLKGNDEGWLRGELHAHSEHGEGTEPVKRLVRRAEKLKLDFLSILDRNTLAPAMDPDYKSKSVVMIPGMEWGTTEQGVALVYAPSSLPQIPETHGEMEAYTRRIQAQGGLVYAGHPCYPTSPWNWRENSINGVQAWCMGWRTMAPMALDQVAPTNQLMRGDDYITSIARASRMLGLSANGQSTAYWDFEMSMGKQLGLIGGSQTGSPKVKMGEPITYVYAKEKSLPGILEGLQRGRTYVSRGMNGPRIDWVGDIFNDNVIDVSMGGIVPIDQITRYHVRVRGASGAKLEVMMNGIVNISANIDSNDWIFSYEQLPDHYSVYRVRVVARPKEVGYGLKDVFAMTSPIYANGIIPDDEPGSVEGWVRIENDYMAPADVNEWVDYLSENFKPVQQ